MKGLMAPQGTGMAVRVAAEHLLDTLSDEFLPGGLIVVATVLTGGETS